MSSNPPYPPSSNANDPTSQQYLPPSAPTFNYGSAYPPPSNQGAYPPPVETVPANNPAFPPPPSYESTFGKPAGQPNPYGQNISFMPAAAPPSYPPPPASSDVEYQGSGSAYHDRIISFNDKTIRLGMFLWKTESTFHYMIIWFIDYFVKEIMLITKMKFRIQSELIWRSESKVKFENSEGS